MKRRSKVELFERIRRAYELEKKSIRAIARQYGVHRRMVRQAIANAIPPDRKTPQRPQPQMDEVKEFIKQILEKDISTAPSRSSSSEIRGPAKHI